MSKYQFQASDIYIPGTDVPKNRLGIEDPSLLHEIEQSLLDQAYQIFTARLDTNVRFDEDFFKALHYHTFVSLYDWAGVYRTVDMSKGGSLFCLARHLTGASQKLFQQLAEENYLKNPQGWQDQAFAERLAFFQCELIALHPFYELNGRITRLFFDLIAIYNGYGPIDYSWALEQETDLNNAYIQASKDCVQSADNSRLQHIILGGLNKIEDSE